MPPIGTSGVGLARNTEPIGGVTFRSILKSTIEASEAASIEDTRHKELLDLQTEPHLHQAWVSFTNLVLSLCEPPLFLVRLRCRAKKNKKKESNRTISKCPFFSRGCRNYSIKILATKRSYQENFHLYGI